MFLSLGFLSSFFSNGPKLKPVLAPSIRKTHLWEMVSRDFGVVSRPADLHLIVSLFFQMPNRSASSIKWSISNLNRFPNDLKRFSFWCFDHFSNHANYGLYLLWDPLLNGQYKNGIIKILKGYFKQKLFRISHDITYVEMRKT